MTIRKTNIPTEYCKICEKQTEHTYVSFYKCHLKTIHDISIKDYFDRFFKKENDGICKVCGQETKFLTLVRGYRIYCCAKCTQLDKDVRDKIKKTNLEKTGYEHPSQNPENWEKIKKTNMERYGIEFPLAESGRNRVETNEQKQNRVVKIKATNLKKYGADNVFRLEEFKEKSKKTLLERYGVDNYNKTDEGRNKIKEWFENDGLVKLRNQKIRDTKSVTLKEKLQRYLPENYKVIDYVPGGYERHRIICPRNHTFEILGELIRLRKKRGFEICTICNPLDNFSNSQIQLSDFIKTLYDGYVRDNDRWTFNGVRELDIYLPDFKFAIEYNGLHWHSSANNIPKDYHLNKTEMCEEIGIRLIHIYEDEWLFKQNIVKSRLRNIFGKISNKIFARKCEIKEVGYEESSKFLEQNHIQGNCVSKIRLGLYYNEELVSLMTFCKQRFGKSREGVLELNRFCNKLDHVIVGAASKLFSYFIKKYEFTEIISYADRSWSQGDLYYKLGFTFVEKCEPRYHYVVNGKRVNRENFQKYKLVKRGFDPNKTEKEITQELNYPTIHNSGTLKFIYKSK